MSRKNRNASRRSYSRVHYKPDHLDPTPMDRLIEEANRPIRERANVSTSHTTMVNERVGYEYKFLTSTVLETDPSYQRRMNAAQVDRIVAEFNPLLVNAVKVSQREGRFFVFDGAHTLAALRRIHEGKPFMVELNSRRAIQKMKNPMTMLKMMPPLNSSTDCTSWEASKVWERLESNP